MSEIIEGKPQLEPGMCFICELSNPVRYIDTLRDFRGVVIERLDGRKYVCEECVKEFAEKLGFISPATAGHYETDIHDLKKALAEARSDIEKLELVKAAIEHFSVKPKAPAKKPVAAKA